MKLPLCTLMTRLIQVHPSTRHTSGANLAALSDEQTRCLPARPSVRHPPSPLLNPAGWPAACPPAAPAAAPITNSGPFPIRSLLSGLPAGQGGRQQDSVIAVSHTLLKVSDDKAGNTFALQTELG